MRPKSGGHAGSGELAHFQRLIGVSELPSEEILVAAGHSVSYLASMDI
jgi:hypothetical protein